MRCWMRLDWILGGCALNDIWRCWKREGGMLRARIIWKKTKRWSNQKNTEDREGGGWSITHLFVCWKVGGNESERDFPIDSVPLLCCSSEGIFRNAIWLNISYITEVLNWIKRRRGQWVELRDRIDWPPERERERERNALLRKRWRHGTNNRRLTTGRNECGAIGLIFSYSGATASTWRRHVPFYAEWLSLFPYLDIYHDSGCIFSTIERGRRQNRLHLTWLVSNWIHLHWPIDFSSTSSSSFSFLFLFFFLSLLFSLWWRASTCIHNQVQSSIAFGKRHRLACSKRFFCPNCVRLM